MNKDTQKKSTFEGTVTGDPLEPLPVGATIQFKPAAPKGYVPEGGATISNPEYYEGLVVHITFSDHVEHLVHGSGVVVAPGIVLCATHVIEPHIESLLTGDVVATCFGATTYGLQIWKVRKFTVVPNNDIIILSVELTSSLPADLTFFRSIVTTRTPEIGEQLTIVGGAPGKQTFPMDETEVNLTLSTWACKGAVVDVFPNGRDSGMIPWPTFAVNVLTHGAMSGGPVYDSNGLLIGLLCSAIKGGDTSFVTMLWPALTMPFEATWPPGVHDGEHSLLEVDRHLFAIDKPDAISVKYEQSGNFLTTYSPW